MKKAQLGSTGILVPPLAFGGNVFGWTIDQNTSFQLLDKLIESNYNFIDTADVYSRWKPGNNGGESETIIGNWLKGRQRDKVIIATKGGGDMGEGKNITKDYILKAADLSLKRLQTDYIDLYQIHFDNEETPVAETLEALSELIKQGKVKAIGASNFSAKRLKQSVEYCKENNLPAYQTFQPEYNLYNREHFEKEYKEFCFNNNITVISYYALASGFLTGKYKTEADLNKSARGAGIKKYFNERGFRILNALEQVANKLQVNESTIALAWLQAQPGIIPIASATNQQQLQQLLKAGEIELDSDSINQLNEASKY